MAPAMRAALYARVSTFDREPEKVLSGQTIPISMAPPAPDKKPGFLGRLFGRG